MFSKGNSSSRITRRQSNARQGSEKLRLGIALAVIALSMFAITARLWVVQVVNGSEYGEIARKQTTGKAPIPAERGVIYDRTGRAVAMNVIRRSLCVYPHSEEEARQVAAYLDKLYHKPRGSSRKEHDIQPKKFRWIDRGIEDSFARKVEEEAPDGIYVREESGREYPFGLVGKQLLGYTDIDNHGISGIETQFEEYLRGIDGKADIQRDGLSNVYKIDELPLIPPRAGRSIILNLDWRFQEIVEEEIKASVEKYNAQKAIAVFVDVNTGEVLAAAHYDPEEKNTMRPSKLRAFTDIFEPGSIFKIVAASAILDEGVAKPDTEIYCEHGVWDCGSRLLHDDKQHDTLSFHWIMAFSSNIGVGKFAVALGGDRLVEACERFGFGQKSMIDFPGEQAGMLHHDTRWSDYNVAALSIGHSVSVTPIQMAMAMAAIANGGNLYRPRILRGLVDSHGIERDNREPELICRVMDESSVAPLQSMLKSVVDSGTATPARSKIVSIAGKTGTAEVPKDDGSGYFKNKFLASFAGYFPAEKPQVAGIVIMDRPEPIHYGGYTSGPTFKNIAERYALAHPDRFGPDENQTVALTDQEIELRETPDFVGLTARTATDRALKQKVALKGYLDEGDVIWQYPPAGEPLGDDAAVAIITGKPALPGFGAEGIPVAIAANYTPDLRGMDVKQATLFLQRLGTPFEVEGIGRIIGQTPAPGSITGEDTTIRLRCDRIASL